MMATRLDNIRKLSNGDDMGDVRIEDVIAQVVAPIQPTPIEAITTTSTIPKTQKQIIKSMVDSGALASGQAVLVDGTYYQPVYASSGSGQDYQQGALENVITYKEGDNKVGGNVNWYSPSGEFQQLTQQQEVNATKDFMQFAAMAGGLFGAPLAIGEALGLKGAAAGAVGQGLLTTGTQLGSGANLSDALMAGLKTGAVPIANAALSQIPQFAALSAPVQATVASAVGNIVANGGELTPAVLLSAIGAGLNAANQPNITPLEGLTNSGRTGDDMGGGYEPDTSISSLPSGVQVASLGETPFRLESGGVPIFAESSGASSVRPPAGYEVMSASLADNKPSGAYYDATANAWLTPTNQFSNVTNSNQIASDANLFNANVNTIDDNVIRNITNQSDNEITLDDITRIIGGQNFATPQDVQTAINSINIPKGLTSTDVQSIVSTALTNNPSLTSADVQTIVNNAVSKIPVGLTADDVTKIIGGQNLATSTDVANAISKIPAGITSTDVQSIVSTALANNPSLTTAQVADIVNSAIGKIPSGLTIDDVTKIISTQSFATPQDVETAIGKIPTGLTSANVQTIVNEALKNNPNLTTDQVSTIVNDALTKLPASPTTQDIVDIIGGQGLASTSQLTQQGKDLMAALQQQGLDYNTALAEALKSQAGQFNTSITDITTQLGGVKTGLESQLTGVQTGLESQIGGVQTGLESKIAGVQTGLESQLTAQGKELLASLQQQGLDYQTALDNALTAQANQLQNQITGVQTGLESQLDAQGKQYLEQLQQRGVDYQTALDEAIAQQNTKIGAVQTSFEEQFKNASTASADNFAKVMLSLAAIENANKPKTFTYDVADPSTWASPVYNQATGPVTPITALDFGNREMLRGTQWEKFLDPNYGQVPAPVQFNQPSNMGYDQLMGILGTGRDTLPSQALTINDVISGIQNQYGQTPAGSMGQKPA
jgi:hypothetical protein